MVKYNYFDTLEQLSDRVVRVVTMACGDAGADSKIISELRKDCDRQICSLEDALFSDFLPPTALPLRQFCAADFIRGQA